MNLDLSEYMGAYIDGSRENLDTMDKMLLSLEQNPSNLEAIEEIFRAAHTLKGMSATMGFEKIAHLTHEMENILDKLRNQQIPVTTQVIDVIFETFDVLRTLVSDSIESTDSNIDLSELSEKLSSLCSGEPAPAVRNNPQTSDTSQTPDSAGTSSAADLDDLGLSAFEISSLEEAGDDGKNIILIKITLVSDCLLKGPRVFMVLRTLDDLQCDIIKSLPEVKDLENEKFDRSFKMLLATERTVEEVHEGIEAISEIENIELSYISNLSEVSEAPPPETFSNTTEEVVDDEPPPVQPASPQYSPPPEQIINEPAASPPTYQPAPSQAPPPVAPPPVIPPEQPPEPPSEEENEEDEEKEIIELVQLVTFTMAGETYALGIQQVEAIINLRPITRVPKAPSYIDGVINLRGEIVPVINTRKRLRLPTIERKASNQIIILAFEEEKVKAGFLVDSVQEVIRLPETAIEPPTRVSESVDIEYLKGVGKIDNRIIIMLNAHRIVFGKKAED